MLSATQQNRRSGFAHEKTSAKKLLTTAVSLGLYIRSKLRKRVEFAGVMPIANVVRALDSGVYNVVLFPVS